MFGHADVGCLHVRPLLDMCDEADVAEIRTISDKVAALTKRHGGLLWGEHGKDYRGEYSPCRARSLISAGERVSLKAASPRSLPPAFHAGAKSNGSQAPGRSTWHKPSS